jgi:hypothetical protein
MTEKEKKEEEARKKKNETARNWYYAHREYVLQREKEKYRNSTLSAPPKPKKPKQTKKKLTALQRMIRFYEDWNSKIQERLDNETLDDFQLWALNLTLKSNEQKINELNG